MLALCSLQAQNTKIYGKVTDEFGLPLTTEVFGLRLVLQWKMVS